MSPPFDPGKLSVSEQVAVLKNLSQAAAAAVLLGVGCRSLRDKAGSVPRNHNRTYSGPDLFTWAGGLAGDTTADPEMAGPDSPALERYRLARAEMAEHELQTRKGDLLPRVEVHEGMIGIAGVLRRAGERVLADVTRYIPTPNLSCASPCAGGALL